MIFPVLSGKMIFYFPENLILFFRRKMKEDLSQENVLKKVLLKIMVLEYDLSCISRKMVFLFPENMMLFFIRKMKDDISQKKNKKKTKTTTINKQINKKNMEVWYFSNCFENIVFPK